MIFIGIADYFSFLHGDKCKRENADSRVSAVCNGHKYFHAESRSWGFLSLGKAMMNCQPSVCIFPADAGHEFFIEQQLVGVLGCELK